MYNSTLSLASTIDGGGWSTPRPYCLTPGKYTKLIAQEVGWAPGSVWTGAEDVAATGIRYPDRPARSESLYRLSYPCTWEKISINYYAILFYVILWTENTYLLNRCPCHWGSAALQWSRPVLAANITQSPMSNCSRDLWTHVYTKFKMLLSSFAWIERPYLDC
jgi:hypothetical protein